MNYKVTNLDNNASSAYNLGNAFKPLMLLPVPYISQVGSGADLHKNDCGAASAIMLLRAYMELKMTPDEFYTKFSVPGDPYLSVLQLRNAMGSLGVLTDYKVNFTIKDVFATLAAGKPLIVTLRYKVFQEAGLTERTYDGPHYSVVVGMDIRNIYLHDPLYTNPEIGNAHAYPLELFWKAWKEVATNPKFPNPECPEVKVNSAFINVRATPEVNSPTLATLKKGELLEVVREISSWGQVPNLGWIYLPYTVAA
ncbi:MAG: C39 family peptidase [Chloroflexi bacterium]|nr:C39 family peptidase [Chloroflexota bacterium]